MTTSQMQSIRRRVDDAQILWAAGRREGAFLLALVAVAARVRLENPRLKGKDREQFEAYLRGCLTVRLSAEYRGEMLMWEQIFYRVLRNSFVHEGEIPPDIDFLEEAGEGALVLRAGGAPVFRLGLSPAWFHKLIAAASR